MYYRILAIISGLLVTLSLAPFSIWPAAIIAAALLFACLEKAGKKESLLLGWLHGLGLFGSGASWVYVSIHDFGYVSAIFAALLSTVFCVGLALCTAVTWWLFSVFRQVSHPERKIKNTVSSALLFSSMWILGEWMRSWLLTGFPWLYIGYSQTESILGGLAPLTGVYGIGFALCFTGAVSTLWLQRSGRPSRYSLLACSGLALLPWLASPVIGDIRWTQEIPKDLRVSIVQANISQHEKWKPDELYSTLSLYETMSEPLWEKSDLVIWPEAALPLDYYRAQTYLDRVASLAAGNNSALLTGIPYRDPGTGRVHNSATVVGNGEGIYHKHRLVPFGEYVPFEDILGGLLAFFELPMSTMHSGGSDQSPLQIADWHSRPLICYEIVYPGISAATARVSDVIITISNDSWFGSSLGPVQHLQMAQMRARETGRYVLRGTGNGISAIISPYDGSALRSNQFRREVLDGNFRLTRGNTPWVRVGYWLAPSSLLLAVIILVLYRKKQF